MWHIFSSVSAISSKRQFQFGFEIVVGFHVVSGNAKTKAPALTNLCICRETAWPLWCSQGCCLWDRKTKHRLTMVRNVRNFQSAGGVGFKFGKGFVENDRHGTLTRLTG
jgi:hypothetical protein